MWPILEATIFSCSRREAKSQRCIFILMHSLSRMISLLRPMGNGRVQFFPTVLRLHPEAEVPVEVVNSHSTTLRAWQRHDLEPVLRQAGFDRVEWYGDLRGGPFDPQTSTDLVFVATRH